MKAKGNNGPDRVHDAVAALCVEDDYWWFRGIRELIRDWLPRVTAIRTPFLLDAGCGSGGLLRTLGRRVAGIGLDVDHAALMAGRRVGTQNLLLARMEQIPLPDACMNVVVSVDALCQKDCLEDAALAEIRRVLKVGGVLLVNLPAYEWLKGPHDEAGDNRRRYTRVEVAGMLAQAGFSVKRLSYRNAFLFPVALVRRLAHKWLFPMQERLDVKPLPRWLNRFLFAVLSLETQFLMRWNLPFGLSVFAVAERDRD